MLLCFVLTAVVALASLICVQGLDLEDRAEKVVAATIVFNSLIIGPVYALGLSGLLTRGNLIAAALVSALVLTAAACRRSPREVVRGAFRLLAGILRMPLDALKLTWRERSPVFLGIGFALLFLIWTAFSVYIAPSYRHWDALWYHEPMIGLAIQNQSFAPALDYGLIAKINGYPRMGEMTQLWFGLLGDRRVIEMPNVLLGPALICSTYKLSRRFSGETTLAAGWGVALLMLPGNADLMQTILIDPQAAALVLASAHFALRRTIATPHAALGGLALGLALGAKYLTLVPVGLLFPILCVRVLRSPAIGRRAVVALACALPVIAMGAATYVRNWINFNNPFWPDLRVVVPALGIEWPGWIDWERSNPRNYHTGINMNLPLGQTIEYLLARPFSVTYWHFERIVDYGTGVAWTLIPLGLVALLLAVPARIADRRRAAKARAESTDASLIAGIVAMILITTPALWAPRYHIVTIGLMSALVSWLCARIRAQQLELAVCFTVQITAIMHLYWEDPREWVDLETAGALLSIPYPEREVHPELGAPVTHEFGLARIEHIGPGDVVVCAEPFEFPALFWNDEYSNQVRFQHNGANFLARAEALGATWVVCTAGSCLREVRAARESWVEVAPVYPGKTTTAFRKLSPSEVASRRAGSS